jgi:hypothetical protein
MICIQIKTFKITLPQGTTSFGVTFTIATAGAPATPPSSAFTNTTVTPKKKRKQH